MRLPALLSKACAKRQLNYKTQPETTWKSYALPLCAVEGFSEEIVGRLLVERDAKRVDVWVERLFSAPTAFLTWVEGEEHTA